MNGSILKSYVSFAQLLALAGLLFFLWAAFFHYQYECCLSTLGRTKPAANDSGSVSSPLQTIPPAVSKEITVSFETINDYLANPGMGWQEDRNFDQPLLPETVSYRRRQYSWAQINPSEGVLDWTPVDQDLQEAIAAGKQFSFRIYTMRGEVFGGHQIPQWVIDQGATLVATGEPYYSNCIYQEKWAQFVESLRQKYDGNPNIAWIDISGYGNFNEWSWRDQTNTDEASPDPKARQRLADMFIGGTATIQCVTSQNNLQTISYTYPGFQHTQLLMPYAGIRQSTRYVAGRRPDVGFRHDCLGSQEHTDSMLERVGDVIDSTWRHAPIVYEFCSDPDLAAALPVLQATHASLVHDNIGNFSTSDLTDLLRFVGYRYALKQASYPSEATAGSPFALSTIWINSGYAPSYPSMGQKFSIRFLLVNASDTTVQEWQSTADVAQWMPGVTSTTEPPNHEIRQQFVVAATLPKGSYQLKVAIFDTRTGKPIRLANAGQDNKGRYPIGSIVIKGSNNCCNSYLPLVVRSSLGHGKHLLDQLLLLLTLFLLRRN